MKVTIECINTQPPEHTFELEIPEEHLTMFEGRGFKELGDVVCPTCGEEQAISGKEIIKVLRGRGSKVDRTESTKHKDDKKKRKVNYPSADFERDPGPGGRR